MNLQEKDESIQHDVNEGQGKTIERVCEKT